MDKEKAKNIEEVSKDTANESRRGLLILSLIRYFENNDNMDVFLRVIQGQSEISLRLLDWLITNYAKSNNVVYNVGNGGIDKQFNMYLNYKTQLKAYSKKQFDPFQRRERISFQVGNTNVITTIGQMNFFRWAIQNKVIDYAQKHLEKIEKP